MKKFFFLLLALVCVNSVKAQNNLYIEDLTAQPGQTVKAKLMMKNTSSSLGAFVSNFFFEGVDLSTVKITAKDPINFSMSTSTKAEYVSAACGCVTGDANHYPVMDAGDDAIQVGIVEFIAPNDLGKYKMTLKNVNFTWTDGTNLDIADVSTYLSVQRAEVVLPMDEGYGLEILPFAAVKPGNFGKIPVYVKAGANLLNIEFDIETPKGLMLLNDAYASSFVLNSSACKNLPTVTISNESALYNGYHVAIKGAKVPPTAQKYVNATSEYVKLGDIDYCVDNTWGDDFLLADGIHKLSIKNIMMQELVSGDIHSGNNITSVFVGNTSADKNPILYGHYTDAVTTKLTGNDDLKEMVKDLVSVDFTSTNVELTSLVSLGSFFDGKLIVNALSGSSLARQTKSGVKWGTVCVPFEFVNNIGNVKFYTLSSVGENYISLKGFSAGETIPANTPLFYNITSGSKMSLSSSQYIDMSSCTPSVAGASADGLTMKGTYETFDLASGAGYYISNNKLYSDGAKIRPFRAYIEGAASVKSLSIFLEDETGLVDITDKFSEEDIYNLQGMKLNKTQKGVNIVGGKKVLVK